MKWLAPEREDAAVLDLRLVEQGESAGAGSDLQHQNAEFALIGEQDRFRRRQRLEHDLRRLHAGLVQASDQRLRSRRVPHDQ